MIGCLMEKEATVPDTYPMTLNGLRQACNQASSRDPVVDYDESTVQRCLDDLKAAGVVRFVHPSHGARSTKYRHVMDERLGLDAAEAAVVGVLALRGAQTSGELRTRTERWHRFESVAAVDDVLTQLAGRDLPLAVELSRTPGQHQTRWMHLLAGPVDGNAAAAAAPSPGEARQPDGSPEPRESTHPESSMPHPAASPSTPGPVPPAAATRDAGDTAELHRIIASLAERVDRLERELGLS